MFDKIDVDNFGSILSAFASKHVKANGLGRLSITG